ncbi:MAG: tetratricopeptide repeat protein [Hydrogenophilus sp.]|nr:tetratricopeptide repeat protein [Hydrogenophilus sp.]
MRKGERGGQERRRRRMGVLMGVGLGLLVGGCATSGERAALPLLERASSGKEGLVQSYVALGLAYLERGRVDVALESVERAAAIDPRHPLVQYGEGLVRLALGNPEEAERAFRTALEGARGDPDLLHAAGSLACEQGRRGEGLQWLQEAAANRLSPRRGRTLANWGWCLAQEGRWREAEEKVEEAVGVAPEDFVVRWRGLALAMRLGEWERAERHLQVLLTLAPDEPLVWWWAANVAQARGDFARAAEWGNRLVREAPDRAETRRWERGEWEQWR